MKQFKIINAEELSKKNKVLKEQWREADPFPLMVIDNFCDENALNRICDAFPAPDNMNKSRDYIFAKNKFEKNEFVDIHPDFAHLKKDLLSADFQTFLRDITQMDLFVDPTFHGGGIHMGGKGSFLDMHADFNIHPLHNNWQREVNILFYLNKDWEESYGGKLKLHNSNTGKRLEIEPLFNRAVFMLTKDYTLHGYDPIAFPEGKFRQSIASYAYQEIDNGEIVPYTTLWHSDTSRFKNVIGPHFHRLVRIKNKIFGSGSHKNK